MMRKRKTRPAAGDGGNNWICFSDLMSALVMVFIMVMLFSMYQYYDMFDAKTAELLEQAGLLTDKENALEESQTALSDAEKNLALKEAMLLAQQTSLDDLKAQLQAQQSNLDTALNDLANAQLTITQNANKLNALVGVRSQIIGALSQALTNANLEATIDEETGDITFSSGIFFDFGSVELKADGKTSLDEFIPLYFNVLLSDDYKEYISEIVIEGHADTNGDYMTNLDLSQRRAYAVSSYLLSDSYPYLSSSQKEMLRTIMTSNGRSYSDPVYNADGSVNMDASRRVEFKFRLKDTEMIAEMKTLLESMGQEYITVGGTTSNDAAATTEPGATAAAGDANMGADTTTDPAQTAQPTVIPTAAPTQAAG